MLCKVTKLNSIYIKFLQLLFKFSEDKDQIFYF